MAIRVTPAPNPGNFKPKLQSSIEQHFLPASEEQQPLLPIAPNASLKPTWGRFTAVTWSVTLGSLAVMLLCPILVILLQISVTHFRGSLVSTFDALFKSGLVSFTTLYAPRFSLSATVGYFTWLAFQATLYMGLPGRICHGQQTPAGHLLPYHTNGFLAWAITHLAYLCAILTGILDPAIIARNWGGLVVAFNIYGYLLPLFAYLKARLSPTHPEDCKFSGSMVYDYYMGIEFNPRFGEWFDFKLFHNGRPGIVMWTLIDLSFMAYQYQLHGFVTRSMVVVNLLHAAYVVDFFWNEDWYLRTIDICHDHYGFYLAWGSMVWLPTVYTLQAQYLAREPYELSPVATVVILSLGVGGYVMFRSVNSQKDLTRRTMGECKIWGRKAEVIQAKYVTADGEEHETLLLCSGWWGVVRHANYLGDLVLSYSVCAAAGWNMGGVLLPWSYAVFMTVLLGQRCVRDEERCSGKYGEPWKRYCGKVRWRLVPWVF